MTRRRNRLAHSQGSVELNLAAMLDMAFQLLTFFILTFRPAPVEGQINLRLPGAQSITPVVAPVSPGRDTSDVARRDMRTLVLTLSAKPDGGISQISLDDQLVTSLGQLDDRLKGIFSTELSPFDQVLIHVDSRLSYSALMSVADVCTRQTILEHGERKPLAKLSFVELRTN